MHSSLHDYGREARHDIAEYSTHKDHLSPAIPGTGTKNSAFTSRIPPECLHHHRSRSVPSYLSSAIIATVDCIATASHHRESLVSFPNSTSQRLSLAGMHKCLYPTGSNNLQRWMEGRTRGEAPTVSVPASATHRVHWAAHRFVGNRWWRLTGTRKKNLRRKAVRCTVENHTLTTFGPVGWNLGQVPYLDATWLAVPDIGRVWRASVIKLGPTDNHR